MNVDEEINWRIMNDAEEINWRIPLLFENMQKVFCGINVFLCVSIMLAFGV